MTITKKLTAFGVLAAVAAVGWFIYPRVLFRLQIDRALQQQVLQNAAAKLLLDAAVTKKLMIGADLNFAKQVLSEAGLEFSVERRSPSRDVLSSIYRAGRWSGFTISVELDAHQQIAKIDIHEYFTGP